MVVLVSYLWFLYWRNVVYITETISNLLVHSVVNISMYLKKTVLKNVHYFLEFLEY